MLDHHAQLIEGNENTYNALLQDIEAKLGLGSSHPDLITFSYPNEKLGIDHAHLIHDALLKYPSMGKYLVVVIYAHTLTDQAQNALLKITEEPPKHSHVFLVTDFIPHLLPTLRSRFVIRNVNQLEEIKEESKYKSKKADILSASNFLDMEVDKRLAIVKDIHSALDKEQITISNVWNFVNQLEELVVQTKDQPGYTAKLEAIAETQQYMHAPGNSVKMLLEYLAIRL